MIVGAQGWATAGKDEVADVLVERFGFVKLSLSEAVNDCLLALNPIIDCEPGQHGHDTVGWYRPVRYAEYVDLHGYVEAKRHPEVRALLQRMGTEVGRNIFGENTWVDIVRRRIEADLTKDYVITNIRFANEVAMVESFRDGFVIEVERPGVGPANDHASENLPCPDPFYRLVNDGTLEDLAKKTEAMYATLRWWAAWADDASQAV